MHVFVTGGTGTIGGPSSPTCSPTATPSSPWPAPTAPRRRWGAPAPRPCAGGSPTSTSCGPGSRRPTAWSTWRSGSTPQPDGLARAIDEETAGLAALGAELVGSDRPIVTASGTPWVAGRVATEADPLATDGPVGGRGPGGERAARPRRARACAAGVRIPRTAHQRRHGRLRRPARRQARRSGVAGYPGDGTQRWPAVHALDAAVLFRLALESAAAGTAWHAVAEEGDAVLDIATVIGRRLGLPVAAVPEEDFGPFGAIFAMDQPASGAHTREALGWRPTHPGLLADLENVRP